MAMYNERPLPKIRTTIALSDVSRQWLRARTHSTGEMTEYIASLIQQERTLGPIESRMHRQADRLDTIIVQTTERTTHEV